MSVSSHGGTYYLFMITHDFSRKSFGYFLKHKNEVLTKFKEWKTFAVVETGNRLQAIRTDNGTEYLNNEFKNFLKKHGIKHQKSPPLPKALPKGLIVELSRKTRSRILT